MSDAGPLDVVPHARRPPRRLAARRGHTRSGSASACVRRPSSEDLTPDTVWGCLCRPRPGVYRCHPWLTGAHAMSVRAHGCKRPLLRRPCHRFSCRRFTASAPPPLPPPPAGPLLAHPSPGPRAGVSLPSWCDYHTSPPAVAAIRGSAPKALRRPLRDPCAAAAPQSNRVPVARTSAYVALKTAKLLPQGSEASHLTYGALGGAARQGAR
eukprot:scaffold1569_cov392-Prasinococcus_capsulatus_cf.AAC.4